jgi:hypothetical protein
MVTFACHAVTIDLIYTCCCKWITITSKILPQCHAVDANTTITNGSDISVREGHSFTISCISTGIPTPSVSWILNRQPVPFQSKDIIVEEGITLVRSDPNEPNSPFIPQSLSTITSNLLVINAQYPDQEGVYVCTGSNDKSMINISSAMINIQVVGKWIRY